MDELPPRNEPNDDPERREESLLDAILRDRRKVYKVRPILEAADDPDALQAEIADRLERAPSPFRTVEAFMVEDIGETPALEDSSLHCTP